MCTVCFCVSGKSRGLGARRLGLGEPSSDTLHLHLEGERWDRNPSEGPRPQLTS